MLLNGDEIQDAGIVRNGRLERYRGASYDIAVDKIINHLGDEVTANTYVLPPNGIVEVISAETIRLPTNICGFASIKTSLCDQGILALNIGIIDPGWQGRLSTTLVNFSKKHFVIRRNTTFLRLSFHSHNFTPRAQRRVKEDDEYIADKSAKAADYFNEVFIDATATGKKAFGEYKNWIRIGLPLVGTFLAVFIAFTTYYATYLAANNSISLTKDFWIPSQTQAQQMFAKEIETANKAALESYEKRLLYLEGEVARMKAAR